MLFSHHVSVNRPQLIIFWMISKQCNINMNLTILTLKWNYDV